MPVIPEILHPDYLLDISALAECFRPYGSHPLNYTLSRLQPNRNTRHMLLGNAANFFIDELIHEEEDRPVGYLPLLKNLFRSSPFDFSACNDLENQEEEHAFFLDCKKHFANIRIAVDDLFPKAGIDPGEVIIEPSFVCSKLGIQGRLDLMLNDFSALVELKSGKAVEDFRTGGQFIHSARNHYTQMILYLAVLQYNLNLSAGQIRSYLLYSRYPVLSKEGHEEAQLLDALRLRNEIVSIEYEIQKRNDPEYTESVLKEMHSGTLNTRNLTGNFFDHYLQPSIDWFRTALNDLDVCERTYFMRLYTFVVKELWLSKAGEREYEGVARASNLWSASFEDKMAAGEILYDLRITDNRAASEQHTVELEIPDYDDLYLPNFRPGDAVVLYERCSDADKINNRQVFKGSIELLENKRIVVRLRYRQRNPKVWSQDTSYALEHDYMDSTYDGMFKSLTAFMMANQDRKDLLLCRRMPAVGSPPDLPEGTDDVGRSVQKALSSDDCFLLVGPPGTGKTSLALRQMVEACLKNNKSNILLLSYTNRAVDEICKALCSISGNLPFIRIGSELNCAPEYREYLMDQWLSPCNRRSEVQQVIAKCRIFVGTVASVWSKSGIFKLKQFDMLIVDEATQLLEPHLLGILCSKTSRGDNAVKRFVLIGDHKQLPAIVLQSTEESKVQESMLHQTGLTDLSNSLFERLYRKYRAIHLETAYDMLSLQGRMHPEIAAFPSRYFYNDRLGCAGLPHQQKEWDPHHMVFYNVRKQTTGQSDKMNREEAMAVVSICTGLYEESIRTGTGFNPENIGVITPYRNQIALIRKLLQGTGNKNFANIMVDTVERFQGGQKEVIIFSFCVNTPGQLNGLPSVVEENGQMIDRKLNVVLTRARERLYVIGDETILSRNGIFNSLIGYLKNKSGQVVPN